MRSPWRLLQSGLRRWWCHTPSAAHALIGIHVGVFVAQAVAAAGAAGGATLLETWGALSGETLRAGQLWRLGAHLFLHDGVLTLLASALLLLFAGRNLEAILGRRHFLALYFLAGITTGLVRAVGSLLPNEGPENSALPIVGDLGAVLAVLLAFTTIMPELELGALIFLPAPGMRLKARALAGAAVLAPAILFLIFTAAPATQAVAGDVDGTLRLACLGALAGVCSGWVYARGLGFGRRWPLSAALRRTTNSRRDIPRDATAVNPAHAHPAPWSLPLTGKSAVLAAGAGNSNNANSSSALAAPPPNAATAAPAAVPAAAPAVSERERRMSTREYISEAVDPILEKITREGISSLTADERRVLEICREKIAGPLA